MFVKISNLLISKFDKMSIMIPSEIKTLITLTKSTLSIGELASKMGISYTRATEIVKSLTVRGFVTRTDGRLTLANTIHATLFKRLASRYDMVKLLGDKREDVAFALLSTSDVTEIEGLTGLKYRTLRRALVMLMETGALREQGGKIHLAEDRDLSMFLSSLKEARERLRVEPYAEVIYASTRRILKRVPPGRAASGFLTAFSAFHRYGVEIHPIYDYYIEQDHEPILEEVLVHAMVASTGPIELTDCAVLLAKNLNRFDLGKARSAAHVFNMEHLLLDLENYVRNLAVQNPQMFLPWEEFTEKAKLYEVEVAELLPRKAFPDLFRLLGHTIRNPLEIYLIGGEVMRMRGLKRATKDVDIVVADETSFSVLRDAVTKLGYRPLGGEEISMMDRRLKPSGIFVREDYPRIDIFTHTIARALILSKPMIMRAEQINIGRLILRMASNEDLLLLKSVTEREGDVYDMIQLAKVVGFDWRIVMGELMNQEKETGRQFCLELLESIEAIEKGTGLKVSIHRQLETHVIEHTLIVLIKSGKANTIPEIRKYLDYPEYRLNSALNRLTRRGQVKEVNGHIETVTPRS